MRIPSFADSKNRTANQPAIMLGIVQTQCLLTEAAQYVRENKIQAKPFKVLRDHLIANGWYRVELHGQQLFLQSVVVYATDAQQTDAYLTQAHQTGNWNFPEFIRKPESRDNRRMYIVKEPKVTPVEPTEVADHETSQS